MLLSVQSCGFVVIPVILTCAQAALLSSSSAWIGSGGSLAMASCLQGWSIYAQGMHTSPSFIIRAAFYRLLMQLMRRGPYVAQYPGEQALTLETCQG